MQTLPARRFRRALASARTGARASAPATAALLAVALVTTAPAVSRAQALPEGVTRGASVEGITEYTLANGLRVLLFPDQSKPTVTVNMTYLVGSRHEGYGETGMAHLLEHLVFKGTPDHPNIPRSSRSTARFPTARHGSIARTTSRRCLQLTRISSGRSIWKPIAW